MLPLIPCKTWPQNYIVDSPAQDTEGKPYVNWSGIIIKLEYILELIVILKTFMKISQLCLKHLTISTSVFKDGYPKKFPKKKLVKQCIR